jgi:cytochrome c-type biogenesis protein CcmE
MRVRSRFFVGAAIIAAAVGYLITTAVRNTSEYYLTVPEAAARAPELEGEAIRVAGRVKPGSISWDPASLTLKFSMYAIPDPAAAPVTPVVAVSDTTSFAVICAGQPKPDMFAPNRDVIVEGRLNKAGVIEATQVMTSCPSKYQPQQGK